LLRRQARRPAQREPALDDDTTLRALQSCDDQLATGNGVAGKQWTHAHMLPVRPCLYRHIRIGRRFKVNRLLNLNRLLGIVPERLLGV
jgi:hypothetical protein